MCPVVCATLTLVHFIQFMVSTRGVVDDRVFESNLPLSFLASQRTACFVIEAETMAGRGGVESLAIQE